MGEHVSVKVIQDACLGEPLLTVAGDSGLLMCLDDVGQQLTAGAEYGFRTGQIWSG